MVAVVALLEAHLVDVVEQWSTGRLSALTAQEVGSFLRAAFIDSDRRKWALTCVEREEVGGVGVGVGVGRGVEGAEAALWRLTR